MPSLPPQPVSPARPAPVRRPALPGPVVVRQPAGQSYNFGIPVLLLGLYLASVSSISSQILIVYMSLPVPLIGLAFLGACAAFLISGRPLAFLRTPFAFPWLALLAWFGLASVAGIYPMGSLTLLLPYSARIHILPFFFVAVAANVKQVRTLMYSFALGYILVILYCYKFGGYTDDRFVIPDTTLGNGNDLALHLMLGTAFGLLFLRHKMTRLLWLGTAPVFAYYVLKTGSRSNMLTLALIVVVSVLVSPSKYRARLAAGMVLLSLCVVPFVPHSTIKRLMTFTQASNPSNAEEMLSAQRAIGSTEARKAMQMRALALTFRNPVFGVGPKMFADATEQMVRETEGHKSTWQATHNSYLQVSAESGIPGFLFYSACIFLCLRLNYRDYKTSIRNRQLGNVALQCFALFLGSVVYAFGILFSSIAYDYHLAALVGFTAANHLAFQAAVRDAAAGRPAG